MFSHLAQGYKIRSLHLLEEEAPYSLRGGPSFRSQMCAERCFHSLLSARAGSLGLACHVCSHILIGARREEVTLGLKVETNFHLTPNREICGDGARHRYSWKSNYVGLKPYAKDPTSAIFFCQEALCGERNCSRAFGRKRGNKNRASYSIQSDPKYNRKLPYT